MSNRMENWTKTTREMLRASQQIGAKPFILFQYFLTWESAKDGIFPPLKLIAKDLDMEPNAICNLRKRLIDAGWIKVSKGRVLILKTFTKNEGNSQDVYTGNEESSQKMNESSQIVNPTFTKNESPLKGLDIKNSSKKKERKEKRAASRLPDPFPLTEEMTEWTKKNVPKLRDVEASHENFIEYYTNLTTKKAVKSNWPMAWKKGMRLALKWQEQDDKNGVSRNGNGTRNNGREHPNTTALKQWAELAKQAESDAVN